MEDRVFNNEESAKLLELYGDIYYKMVEASNQQNKAELSSLKESYNDLMLKINNNVLAKEMFEAKEKFDKMIATINKIINFAITGEDEDQCCESGCTSCCDCNS